VNRGAEGLITDFADYVGIHLTEVLSIMSEFRSSKLNLQIPCHFVFVRFGLLENGRNLVALAK
jgi:hypothetical protein